ncbi:MAG: ATP-dependent Clp protease proteolytic subunit [Methylacidiphilales bacterium]|nr:ATP-dependent Clp protease proteolytic subunit [Candidatus Methylacidiphilales bacterium]
MSPGVLSDFHERIISVLGQVEERDFDLLNDQLLRLDTHNGKPITIYLSAKGGNLVDVLKVVDVVATLRSTTVGIGMGLLEGASAAILIAMQKRIMMPSALLFLSGLWNLPSHQENVGLHPVSTTSLQTHLHQRLNELETHSPQLAQLVREAEKQPRFITASEALQLGLCDQIHGLEDIQNKTRRHHVR